MAIYRIYPEKDATVLSKPNVAGVYGNAGLDEILELRSYPDDDGIGRSSRILIKFSDDDISNALSTKISGSYSASLHMYLADAAQLPTAYTIETSPISKSWIQGTGKLGDTPINTSGVSWTVTGGSTLWDTPGCDFLGGSKTTSQIFALTADLDINVDVTGFINSVESEEIDNHGLVVKFSDNQENETTSSIALKYFSCNSNTIFPPYLEFKWDDSKYDSELTELTTDISTVGIKNHKEKYIDSEISRFRLSARPKYPTRTFSTGSIYKTEYKLPENSCYAIKDEYSEEMIIDFDSKYTKISADNTSSYFDIHMDTLQPERYYRLLVKTILDGSTVVLDNKNVFKVVRNG